MFWVQNLKIFATSVSAFFCFPDNTFTEKVNLEKMTVFTDNNVK